eukprot:Opistho-2@73643
MLRASPEQGHSTEMAHPIPFVPNYTLDEKHKHNLDELRKRVFANTKLTKRERLFCEDACLVRYLRARDWDVNKAEELIHGSLKWRREYKPEHIDPATLEHESSSGKLYRYGFDKQGRPVFCMRPKLQNTKNYVDQVRLTVFMLEEVFHSMDRSKGVEQMVLMIDFDGYSVMNAPPMHVSKEVMHILTLQYPERLGLAILVDAPFLFTMAYSVLSPFIPIETRKKIHFVKGSHAPGSDKQKLFAAHFDLENVEEFLGGTSEWVFDHKTYWPQEVQRWRERREKEDKDLDSHVE